jgi:Zn-dependent protease/CBS domain-containing protein
VSSGIRIARIAGVSISLHVSWLVIVAWLTYAFAELQFPGEFPDWSPELRWGAAAATALLFVVSVLVHELSHALVARRVGVHVTGITLFIFGGATAMESEPRTPGQEALIVAAGPVSSLVLGTVLWLAQLPLGPVGVGGILGWLAFINLTLGAFNLVPGFPMDGGRLLRALLWRWRGDRYAATRSAATIGQFVAYGLIAIGVLLALNEALVTGIWLGLIGWFLSTAAEAEVSQLGVERTLHGVRVRDIMDADPPSVSPNESVADLVNERMLRGEHRTFLVRHDDGGLAGLISLSDVRRVPRESWDGARVTDVMTRFADLATVSPDDEVEAAMKLLQTRGVDQLPVISEGRSIAGLVTRLGIMRLIETRLRLGV